MNRFVTLISQGPRPVRISALSERCVRNITLTAARCDASVGSVIPISIRKDTSDPVILEDADYPQYVSELASGQPSLRELETAITDLDSRKDAVKDVKRLAKLSRRRDIKDRNSFADIF